jgi:outer membrane protein TolC
MGARCRAFLVTSAFIWLSACAVGPDYELPAVTIPKAFGTASLMPAVPTAPATADFARWWQIVNDRQLNALIEWAIASNPDIEIALTRVQEARSQEIVVVGAMLPTVGGSGTVAAGSGSDLTRGRVAQSIRAGDSARGARSISRIAGFDAGWELDLFGKYHRSLEAAGDDAEALIEMRNAALITVIADVARNYLEIRGLQIRLVIARKDIETAQTTVDLLMSKSDRGQPKEPSSAEAKQGERTKERKGDSSTSKELDLALAMAEVATRQARLPELNAAISAAVSRLALLLGTYSADLAGAIRGAATLPGLPEHLRPGMPVELLRRRPDIRAAERELAAATARIGVATANLFPSVALTAGFGGQGTTGQGTGTPISGPIWSFGPRAYWPLLDFGRLDALINIEELRAHEALVKYKETIIAAVEETDQAIQQYHFDLQRLKALGAALEAIRHAVDLETERYRRGEADFRSLLNVQRRHYALEEQTAITAEAAVLRYVAFYKALGGGWELDDALPPIPPAQPAIVATVGRLLDGWHWR